MFNRWRKKPFWSLVFLKVVTFGVGGSHEFPSQEIYGHKDENWTRLLTPTETNIHYHKLLFISVGTYSSHKAFKLFLFLVSKYISPLAVQRIFVEALNFCVFYLKNCVAKVISYGGVIFLVLQASVLFSFSPLLVIQEKVLHTGFKKLYWDLH